MKEVISGDLAFAYGAINASVQIITGYPGSPSSGTFDALKKLQKKHGFHMEWSLNEKVACEVAIGSSIGGLRSLVCTKNVGLNVMIDPLMALNLTPLNAGLVILLGDDPQGYGSQNDQDSRTISHFLEMPLWEPATPGEAFRMITRAFEISESYGMPIIIRETRNFSQYIEETEVELTYNPGKKELIEEPFRFVPVPENAVAKHLDLQKRLDEIRELHESSGFNKIQGKGKIGIITAGFVHQKVMDVLGESFGEKFKVLKLGTLYPLPERLVCEFVEGCSETLIFEESSIFIENAVKIALWNGQTLSKVAGKKELGLLAAGELFRGQISEVLSSHYPQVSGENYQPFFVKEEYPKMKSNCGNSRYEEVLALMNQAAFEAGVNPLYVGDPGCIFLVGEKLLAKYAIGSAAGVASGLNYADLKRPIVAFIGDSGFFHTSMQAIANAAYTHRNFLIILLDNNGALTTGNQPTPAMGSTILDQHTEPLNFGKICGELGVKIIEEISLNDNRAEIAKIFARGLTSNFLNLIIVKIPRDG